MCITVITFDTLYETGILYNNGLIFDTNMCSIIAVSNCHHMPGDMELLVFCRLGDAFCMHENNCFESPFNLGT